EIQHNLIRECMKITNTSSAVEMTSFADIPSRGSGLGSSSSFAVGLISALQAYQGAHPNPEDVAALASDVEIRRLGEPVGKQDQYAAAFGGLNGIVFHRNG